MSHPVEQREVRSLLYPGYYMRDGGQEGTHNKTTALIEDILLQGRLVTTQRLGKADARNEGANLIIHHGTADVLNHAAKFVHIPGAIQEPRDLASLFQWDELLKNVLQFPNK